MAEQLYPKKISIGFVTLVNSSDIRSIRLTNRRTEPDCLDDIKHDSCPEHSRNQRHFPAAANTKWCRGLSRPGI